jgi:hypothetical protein
MRLPLSRATALVAIITALAMASGFAPARVGPGGRDRLLRLARGGPQRLESPDGPVHCHEETDAVHVPSGAVIDTAALVQTPPGPDVDQPIPTAAITATPILPFSPRRSATLHPAPRHVPARADLQRYAPDRAPPAA